MKSNNFITKLFPVGLNLYKLRRLIEGGERRLPPLPPLVYGVRCVSVTSSVSMLKVTTTLCRNVSPLQM